MRGVRLSNVARVLKEARERQELTQEQVAKLMKYSSGQFISNWERGLARPPLRKLPKLLDTLRVPRTKFTEAYLTDCAVELEQCLK